MPGAGTGPAGVGPAGYDPIGAPPTQLVRVPASSVQYDPTTKDFAATNGYWNAIHWVDQAVTLALTIEQGKLRSVPNQGVRYRQIKRLGLNVHAQVVDMTNEALALLLAPPPKIEIISIESQQPNRGTLLIAVTYRNLVTLRTMPSVKVPVAF